MLNCVWRLADVSAMMCHELAIKSNEYVLYCVWLFFANSSFSDLSSVMSSEQDEDSDEETLDAMECTETMELDTEDPDATVNDDHIVDDVQESHDSNSHNSKTLFSMSLLVHYGLIVACSERVIFALGNLLELTGKKCRRPDCFNVCNMSHKFSGCTLIIRDVCQQGYYFQWTSSHAINNKNESTVHEDNMLFSIAVVLSGNNF